MTRVKVVVTVEDESLPDGKSVTTMEGHSVVVVCSKDIDELRKQEDFDGFMEVLRNDGISMPPVMAVGDWPHLVLMLMSIIAGVRDTYNPWLLTYAMLGAQEFGTDASTVILRDKAP